MGSGIKHNFDEEQRRNKAFETLSLGKLLRRLLTYANTRITARSQSTYMQDAGFDAGRSGSRRPPGLSGPIRILTGRLFRGVGIRFSERGGSGREGFVRISIQGGKATLEKGVTVPYAAVHEYGFSGTVTVPSHQRVIRQVFGRPITPRPVEVRSHSRQMNIEERPFLRPALRDETPAIGREGFRLLAGVMQFGPSFLNQP